jgi:hemerythrin-like domain-containing protein
MPSGAKRLRREFLLATAAGTGLLAVGRSGSLQAAEKEDANAAAEDVSPGEDLMREHGVLLRVLLIYDEVRGRLDRDQAFPLDALVSTAKLVRRFLEDYHAKLEEEFVFPALEKAGPLVKVTKVLRQQHQAGRALTDRILQAGRNGLKTPGESKDLSGVLKAFVRMYLPHAAREDTIIFPAFHKLFTPKEYDALGDQFEEREHKLLGQDGFEHAVEEVATLEKTLGIDDLAKFTPAVG